MAQHQFQTEVNQLLHLIIHSLYSHKEIFLRELISNASDAVDKLKYLSLTDDKLKELAFEPRIDIRFTDKDNRTLEIEDNGVGMNGDELAEHLGTIAKSGTKAFLNKMTGDAKKDSNLIGQFGVGFYSAFMVADKIEVISRKAGDDKAWKWTSDGKTGFDVEEFGRMSQGTLIRLHLNEEGHEYANEWSIKDLVKKYSNHIAFPIFLHADKIEYDDKGKEKSRSPKTEQINSASALWKRSKTELKDDDYKEFYKSNTHDYEDPLFWLHTNAEGSMEYSTLFFVPKKAPMDLYHADYKPGVKLYVRRVFITDDNKELLPTWLRFVRGVIDSEDLPLNVSREILQQNKIMANIRNASIKKILGEFARIAKEEPETWKTFIAEYNRPLKEGLYSDYAHREDLSALVRFKSTQAEGLVSFDDYLGRMQAEQKAIYYITGGKEAALRASPLLEAYKKKGIEVLIADDEIDEIVLSAYSKHKDKELKAVNRSDASDDIKDEADEKKVEESKPIAERVAGLLGDKVKEVRISSRLSDSPSCVVADSADPTFQMQAMMRAMGNMELPASKPILELNPDHMMVKSIKDADDERAADLAHVLLDQALLLEGAELADKADFVKRLNRLLG
jgi:molecular chaperone HtpG